MTVINTAVEFHGSVDYDRMNTSIEYSKEFWDKVLGWLGKAEQIETRETEHDYREDSDNITWIQGMKLTGEVSVESLWFKENWEDDDSIPKHLVRLYDSIGRK